MDRVSRKLPSPVTVIALVALVAALGGTAVALPGKNTVKRDDIAKNAVNGKKVKNESLTGKDVKGLTGKDIKEASLAKVPTAAQADTATNATNAGNAATVSTLKPFGPLPVAEGQEQTLHSQGPISVVGQCLEDGTGTDTEVHAVTTEEGSVFAGDDDEGLFGPATAEADRTFEEQGASDVPGGDPDPSDGYDDQFWVSAPGGATFHGTVGSTANADTSTCSFFGSVVVVK
jgi:hypothetical protein